MSQHDQKSWSALQMKHLPNKNPPEVRTTSCGAWVDKCAAWHRRNAPLGARTTCPRVPGPWELMVSRTICLPAVRWGSYCNRLYSHIGDKSFRGNGDKLRTLSLNNSPGISGFPSQYKGVYECAYASDLPEIMLTCTNLLDHVTWSFIKRSLYETRANK